MVLHNRLTYFLEIFKPGFLGGSIGTLAIVIIGHLFESEINQTFNFDLLWILPIALTGIGLALGIVLAYRQKQKKF